MDRLGKLRKNMTYCDGFYISSRANIFYYSGFTSEDAALLITADRQILITDSRYIIQAKMQSPDFEVYNSSDGCEKLFKALNIEKLGFEGNYLTYAHCEKLKTLSDGAEIFAADNLISGPRRKKEDEEIKKIAAAEALGDSAFEYILNIIRAGMTEREVAFELEMYMRKNGASGTSFDTIVASGVRSALPHGTATDKLIENGDFVTMDFGCVLDGYCSDMTRTVVIKKAGAMQREIYDVVLSAQMAAIEAIGVGKSCRETDYAARKIIEEAGYGKNFGHALGHSVGIEIHENPVFSPKSPDFAEEGNVITVEPGIYIENFGGVRIEDVVAISTKNTANLTKSEKDLIII